MGAEYDKFLYWFQSQTLEWQQQNARVFLEATKLPESILNSDLVKNRFSVIRPKLDYGTFPPTATTSGTVAGIFDSPWLEEGRGAVHALGKEREVEAVHRGPEVVVGEDPKPVPVVARDNPVKTVRFLEADQDLEADADLRVSLDYLTCLLLTGISIVVAVSSLAGLLCLVYDLEYGKTFSQVLLALLGLPAAVYAMLMIVLLMVRISKLKLRLDSTLSLVRSSSGQT